MPDPVLHLLVGPNGSGKSTLFATVLEPVTHLDFVNADVIATETWPGDEVAKSYDAAIAASQRRSELLDRRSSFVTETVFSHESKLDLVDAAVDSGYVLWLHVVMVPEALAVARVRSRVAAGGHAVPEEKIRERYRRLWPLVAVAVTKADRAVVYDNSRARVPFRVVAEFDRGTPVGELAWPDWTPSVLHRLAPAAP